MITTEELYSHYISHPVISTDSRNIPEGCLFFALKGENFNANEFALQAIEKGAAYAIVDEDRFHGHDQILLAENVLSSLQDLARHHRSQLNIPVIGLTGSNGKTTSKELINAVLKERYKTFATSGNLNNHIGVPLSILSINSDTEIAIIEMGANHQKEIALLSAIAQPTHGIITNVGMAHLEGFGGFEGVKKGKAELYDFLKAHHGYTFINRDNAILIEMAQKAGLDKLIYYGTQQGNTIKGSLKSSDPMIEVEWTNHEHTSIVKTNLTGSYNFENILSAICIGDFFDMSAEEINHGLSSYIPKNNRSQIAETASNTVICDFYNANPSSMTAAIKNLSVLTAKHKIAIIGDMFELGNESEAQHRLVAEQAASQDFDTFFIGKFFFALKDEIKGRFFESPELASEYLKQHPLKEQLILLKGSRGMKLESLLPYL